MKQNRLSNSYLEENASSQTSVQSVSRALNLLEAFPTYGPEIGLTEISNQLGLNKATAHRLLATLEARGYVERSVDGRLYRLGLRAFELGLYYQNQLDIRRISAPYLNQMVKESGETAFLCIRDGDEAICIDRVESDQNIQIFTLRVGERQPLHCGAAPRALIPSLSESELIAYVQRTGLPKLNEKTIKNFEELQNDILFTLERGYVVSNEDVTTGVAAVGAPIRDHKGEIIAAISLSGLAAHYDPARIKKLSIIISDNAKKISRQLGFRE
jgi:DNA-binding IclR family transcriptional regulator